MLGDTEALSWLWCLHGMPPNRIRGSIRDIQHLAWLSRLKGQGRVCAHIMRTCVTGYRYMPACHGKWCGRTSPQRRQCQIGLIIFEGLSPIPDCETQMNVHTCVCLPASAVNHTPSGSLKFRLVSVFEANSCGNLTAAHCLLRLGVYECVV